ncbi:hypothetical protein DM860_011033 [Cuscuta australis]|uniref:Leucine-rich repeat-containing N-terminal plant-type domain-containing protein n=1 Tax=Cuscuta australis TaxID=267555 RepID=A0A328E525_9ASTE|nr:hypothetical protein DM860_011033 [Cuscuta australis]
MATQFKWLCINASIFMSILSLQARAHINDLEGMITNSERDVQSLQQPITTRGLRAVTLCGESWTGVRCSGSSVIDIKLKRLNLTGTLRLQLSNLRNLEFLDLSYNKVQGEIPFDLPRI